MITILSGENSFVLGSELRRIVAAFVAEYGDMALEQFDGQESEFSSMQAALQSLPFLVDKKIVVLRQPSANKQFVEQAEVLLKEVSDDVDVVIVETKLDKRTAYYKLLKKQKGFAVYEQLDTPQLSRWLATYATEHGGSLQPRDASYLVERVGSNQQMLSNEILKLLHYDPAITRATIDLLTDKAPQSTIFELLDAALAGKHSVALNLYKEQRAMKVEPQQIIALLGWQLHAMALVKTAGDRSVDQIAKEAKLNPFVVRKTQGVVRSMSMDSLRRLIHDVSRLDMRLKSESIDADEALKNLIVSIN